MCRASIVLAPRLRQALSRFPVSGKLHKALAWSSAALPGLGAALGTELGKETLKVYCQCKTRKLYALIANENAAIGEV